MAELTVLSPLGVQAAAVGGDVVVTGTGQRDVAAAAARLRPALAPGTPVALAGTARALDPDLRPGQLVVATELRTPDGAPPRPLPSAALLAAELRRAGLDVRTGPVVSTPLAAGPPGGGEGRPAAQAAQAARAEPDAPVGLAEPAGLAAPIELSSGGALAVDADSAWAAAALADHPLAVVRSIAGPAGDATWGGGTWGGTQDDGAATRHPNDDGTWGGTQDDGAATRHPNDGGTWGGTQDDGAATRHPNDDGTAVATGDLRAIGSLLAVRPALERWAAAVGPRRVLLAAPRSYCAGVERAIEIVERALERFGPPVYVRRQIVHNAHVVDDLAAKGAVFVQELTEVPAGATVVLAAHGVSPHVREQAARRHDLAVIDATCPLVAKVHHEARRFVSQDYQIALVGHADHEEVVGTVGEAPDRIHLVEGVDDVASLPVDAGAPMAYLTQTTLATDETAEIVAALRDRFPGIVGPNAGDICYATQNRQDAVRAMAHDCDLVLVVGSANSSNTARLVEVARREGSRAEMVEDAGQLRLAWLDGAATVGLTAGASAPESLVQEVIDTLGLLGPVTVEERSTNQESVRFSLPMQVR